MDILTGGPGRYGNGTGLNTPHEEDEGRRETERRDWTSPCVFPREAELPSVVTRAIVR